MKLFSWFSGTTFTKRAKIAAAVVTVLAFVASFSHIYQLAYEVGESRFTALLIPLIIDVSVLAGVYTGLAAAQENRSRGVWSWLALWVGGSATIAANLASSEDNVTAKLISVTPPVFLIITIEVLAYLVNRVETREPEPVKAMTAREMVRANPNITAEEIVTAKGIGLRYAERIILEERSKDLRTSSNLSRTVSNCSGHCSIRAYSAWYAAHAAQGQGYPRGSGSGHGPEQSGS